MYWRQADVDKALAGVASGESIRGTATRYGMTEGMLRFRLKKMGKREGLLAQVEQLYLIVPSRKNLETVSVYSVNWALVNDQ